MPACAMLCTEAFMCMCGRVLVEDTAAVCAVMCTDSCTLHSVDQRCVASAAAASAFLSLLQQNL